ncbi:hypothetical protein OAE80_03445 [Planctomycetaceae bacterium]|nr:hypothetical protein [Planctomycetaceae bacterium]
MSECDTPEAALIGYTLIAEKQQNSLWLVNGAAHEDLHQAAPNDYRSKVLSFLEQHLKKTD